MTTIALWLCVLVLGIASIVQYSVANYVMASGDLIAASIVALAARTVR